MTTKLYTSHWPAVVVCVGAVPIHSTPDHVIAPAELPGGLQVNTSLRLPAIILVVAFVIAIVVAPVPMLNVTVLHVSGHETDIAVEVAGFPAEPYTVSHTFVCPLCVIWNSVEDAKADEVAAPTTNAGPVERLVTMLSLPHGVEVAMPTFPAVPTVEPPRIMNAGGVVVANVSGEVLEIKKSFPASRNAQPSVLLPSVRPICGREEVETVRGQRGEVVLIPSCAAALSQKNSASPELPKRTVDEAFIPPWKYSRLDVALPVKGNTKLFIASGLVPEQVVPPVHEPEITPEFVRLPDTPPITVPIVPEYESPVPTVIVDVDTP